jgi:predicted acyltransferase
MTLGPSETTRVASLDAFRGFAIAAMMLVNNPGDWDHVYAPLLHAEWNGWTFTDLVFPFFLFISGVSLGWTAWRRTGQGAHRGALFARLARRAGVLFLVGLALNFIPAFDLATVRIPGVLQRIALCVFIAAPFVVWGSARAVAFAATALLVAYTVPMLLYPVPDATGIVVAGTLEPGRDFGAWIDRELMGAHLWSRSRTWDPEGLVSTLPAAASLLLGALAGGWLLTARAPAAKTAGLAVAGVIALALGLALDTLLMPINKNLWTPSYCVFMTGCSLVVFAAFHAVMDARPQSRASAFARAALLPLTIYGMNALFLFALSGLAARMLGFIRVTTESGQAVPLKAWILAPIRALPIPANDASVAYAIAFSTVMFAVAWGMWRMKWFVKV